MRKVKDGMKQSHRGMENSCSRVESDKWIYIVGERRDLHGSGQGKEKCGTSIPDMAGAPWAAR